MKRLHLFVAIGLFSIISLQAAGQAKNVKQVSNSSADQPYKVEAANISIGNAAYAQKVLWAWKYFDDNTLDKMDDLFADDIVATFPDGSSIKGKAEFMKGMKDFRNNLAAVSSAVDACTALKSPNDPAHEVVSIWGEETDTAKDGTVTKTHLNEVWFFDKQGKVTMLHQLAAKDAPEKK